MKNHKRVMAQLSETEVRFMKLDEANTALQEEKDMLLMDIEDMKK